MADIFDQASERETRDREYAIKQAVEAASHNRLTPRGICYNCSEPLATGGLFCDRDCSADYEHRMRMRRY